jgi:hypothetical protein
MAADGVLGTERLSHICVLNVHGSSTGGIICFFFSLRLSWFYIVAIQCGGSIGRREELPFRA